MHSLAQKYQDLKKRHDEAISLLTATVLPKPRKGASQIILLRKQNHQLKQQLQTMHCRLNEVLYQKKKLQAKLDLAHEQQNSYKKRIEEQEIELQEMNIEVMFLVQKHREAMGLCQSAQEQISQQRIEILDKFSSQLEQFVVGKQKQRQNKQLAMEDARCWLKKYQSLQQENIAANTALEKVNMQLEQMQEKRCMMELELSQAYQQKELLQTKYKSTLSRLQKANQI